MCMCISTAFCYLSNGKRNLCRVHMYSCNRLIDMCTVFMHAAYAGIERIVAQEHDHQHHQMQPFPVSTKCTVHHHFNLLEQNRYCHNTVYILCSQNYQQLSFENNNAPPLPLHGQDSRSLWLSWPFFYCSLLVQRTKNWKGSTGVIEVSCEQLPYCQCYGRLPWLLQTETSVTYWHSYKPHCQSISVDSVGDVLGECHWLIRKVRKFVLSYVEWKMCWMKVVVRVESEKCGEWRLWEVGADVR